MSAVRDYARMLTGVRGARVWNARGRHLIGADVTGSFHRDPTNQLIDSAVFVSRRTVGLTRADRTG